MMKKDKLLLGLAYLGSITKWIVIGASVAAILTLFVWAGYQMITDFLNSPLAMKAVGALALAVFITFVLVQVTHWWNWSYNHLCLNKLKKQVGQPKPRVWGE